MSNQQPPRKPALSPTQLGLLARCGEAYRRTYIDREPRQPPGMSLLVGSGVHHAAAHDGAHKLRTGESLPIVTLREFTRDGVLSRVEEEGLSVTDEELALHGNEQGVLNAIYGATERMIDVYAADIAPAYQPLYVEQGLRIELPKASHDLYGIVDLIAEDVESKEQVVVDYKTGRRKKPQAEADDSLQLTFYAACAKSLAPEVEEVRFETLVETKSGVAAQRLSSHRTDDDIRALVARVNVAIAAIEAGVYLPAEPTSWWCSARWCQFYSTCPYVAERSPRGKEST